ncbi:MAG: DUF1846 domain-containing protein [Bacilli bacterium]|jgi:uncharacterized protein (UPF0371 family)|nr:DUF1846 domain-containing protein [Bacilli bacterium]HHU23577.1 DUF1846 domain-containing protein [Acholeplasmataceae bacterium]
MQKAFDNGLYLELQSKKIKERLNQFGTKLYLEFGGKLFDDFHASRVLPGFASNAKIKTLMTLKDDVEMIIVVNANDIQVGKMRFDIGITYDQEVIRMMELFRELDLQVCGVVITQFSHQELAIIFKNKLENMGVKVYLHSVIPGYPLAIDYILSDEGFGKNAYIETTRPLVVVTAPGPGSGKIATCLSQLYLDNQKGIKSVYAKYETFPVWNLPLNHPVNLAYEAATANINDINMIDPYHLEAYGMMAVNYNRDVEVFPILRSFFERIYGTSFYQSPTDMGINMAGFCIIDDEVAKEAAKQEIIRRYYSTKRDIKNGNMMEEAIEKISVIMKKLGISVENRLSVQAALDKAQSSGTHAMAIELNDGTIITGRRTKLLDAPAAMLLNALKYYANVDDDLKLISPSIIEPIQTLNKQYIGVRNPRLHVNDVLIALSINALTNPSAEKALQQLPKLARAQAHSTVFLTEDDEKLLKRLQIDVTTEPVFRVTRYQQTLIE